MIYVVTHGICLIVELLLCYNKLKKNQDQDCQLCASPYTPVDVQFVYMYTYVCGLCRIS